MKKIFAGLFALIMAFTMLPFTASASTPSDMISAYFPMGFQKPKKPYIQYENDPVHWDTLTAWFDVDDDLQYLVSDARKDSTAFYEKYNVQYCEVHFQFDCNVDNTGWQANSDWEDLNYDLDSFSPFEPEYGGNYELYDIDKSTISQIIMYSFEPGNSSVFKGKIFKTSEDGYNLDLANHTYAFRYRYIYNIWDNDSNPLSYRSPWSDVVSIGKNATQTDLTRPTSLDAITIGGSCLAEGTAQELENHFYIDIYEIPQSIFDAVRYFNIYENPENRSDLVVYQAQYRVNSGTWTEYPFLHSTSIDFSTRDQGQLPTLLKEGDKVEIRVRVKAGPNKEIVSAWSNVQEFTAPVTDYNYKESSPTPTPSPAPKPTPSPAPAVKPEPAISSLTPAASESQVTKFVTSLKNDNDPKGAAFSKFLARQKKVSKNSVTLTWNKVSGAKTYVVYGNKCGNANRYEKISTVNSNSFTQKKLKKGTYYKYLVSAFDASGKHIATSCTVHIATKGGKFCNFKKVTTKAKKNKVTLAKKGKSFKLKAKAVKESKKLKANVHRKVRYESSDKKIATVDSKGKIKAKKKGTCYVYAYAQNGAYSKIKVTVKK